MPNWLPVVLQLLQTIIGAVTPELRAAALSELQTLIANETAHPLLDLLLKEALAIISGAPAAAPVAHAAGA